ncbi:MAG: hypothetical protein HUU47_03050 [Bacteroidetes bacterium]|nr:hypothetical protein [Bacteroidota bacterium]
MEKLTSKLQNWVTEYLNGSDDFIIEIESKSPFKKYKIVIDGIKPVSISRCSELSKFLSKKIDEDTEINSSAGFTLEVSSPGADMPLKLLNQFYKHIGRKIEIVTKEKIKYCGELKSIENNNIFIERKVSKNETATEKIEFNNIEKALVIITFK